MMRTLFLSSHPTLVGDRLYQRRITEISLLQDVVKVLQAYS
jgi:hypothetical protein